MTPGATGALGRVIRRAALRQPDDAQRCDLCGVPVPDAHPHLLDERHGEPLCACRPCALLFEREEADRGHYRLVPGRRVRLAGISPADLGVPVGLAFFVCQPGGGVTAHYPSPAGATRWELASGAWQRAVQRCEPLRSMRPGVEALLVNTAHGSDEQWLVPIDDCYRLVALVRREWKGLSGGRQVWAEVGRFFADLAARAGEPASACRPRQESAG
ncbi:MAG TPA: DUF5947 family protein [Streptosporangiaceae bacterium]|nr:DUF5947 family protein [Streptosporangiaceae bacterium]